jgi:hypothetical protein
LHCRDSNPCLPARMPSLYRSQDSHLDGRISNQTSPESESSVVPLRQPFQYEDVWWSCSTAPPILNLSTRCRWTASSTPRPLCSEDSGPPYLMDTRPDEPQSHSGQCGVKFLSPPGIEQRFYTLRVCSVILRPLLNTANKVAL